MNKIYVVNDTGKDMSACKKFGEIHSVLFAGTQNIFDHQRLALDCKIKLREFSPDEDLLLLSGAGSICSYCVGLLLAWHGKVSVLIWDAKQKVYVKQRWSI